MILALMCLLAPSVFAQNAVEAPAKKKISPFVVDASFNASSENSGKQLYNSTLRLAYTPVWRLGVVGEAGSNLMLFKKDGIKTWDEALTLGGGLSFRQVPARTSNSGGTAALGASGLCQDHYLYAAL